jgi:cephalosporin hydroxylase
MFEELQWQKDRVLLNDLVFRLQHTASDDWELGDECFVFYKIKKLVDQYASFFDTRKSFKPETIFELGVWDGGSVAFWFEHFRPKKKHIGIDISNRGDSEYFRRYVTSRGLDARVKNYWGVDQSDSARLKEIVVNELGSSIDLVIDDASHLYGLTKSSFEILFPFVTVGGFYIIEDWAWEHWKEFGSFQPWAREIAPTKLVCELVEATGSSTDLIQSVSVYEGFTAIERGPVDRTKLDNFRLDEHIVRRPRISAPQQTIKNLFSKATSFVFR